MPYIDEKMRYELDNLIEELVDKLQTKYTEATDGRLNYIITRLLASTYKIDKDPRYSKINDIIGILECAKLEFYARVARPYEDLKTEQNGDVKEYGEGDKKEKCDEVSEIL